MTQTEALKLALEALERGETELRWKAITAIKEALAQPEQEPVGEVLNERGEVDWISFVPSAGTNLYTTPPQRKPLTDEEIPEGVLLAIQRAGLTLVMTAHGYHLMNLGLIEAAHGIKGEA